MNTITVTNASHTRVRSASPQAADRRLTVGFNGGVDITGGLHAPRGFYAWMLKAPAFADVATFRSGRPLV